MAFLDSLMIPLANWLDRRGYISEKRIPQGADLFSAGALLRGEITPGEAMNTYADYSGVEFQRLAITNYPIYRNVMLIGRIISEADFIIEERDQDSDTGWTKVEGHHYSRIMEEAPNRIMSSAYIWLYQVVWLNIRGESYWLQVPDGFGIPNQVYPLPADRVKPLPSLVPDALQPIRGYAYTPVSGKEPEIIQPEQICYHRFPNIVHYYRGMSPLSSYLIGLQTNFEAQKTDLEDFQHRLRLQKLLSMPLGTSNPEFNIALADLQEQEAQGQRWRLIRAGDLKAETISGNRQETQAEIFSLTEHQANAALGVPDGIWEDTNRATAQEHRATLIENTVWPIMSMMAQDITVQVVVPNYGPDFRARFEDIRPRNRELILKETASAREAQTYDEARQAEGNDPHPDSDVGLAPFESAGQAYILKMQAGMGFTASLAPPAPDSNGVQVLPPQPALQITAPDQLDAIQASAEQLDLKRWKSVSLRLLRKGKNPADYDFQPEALSPFKRYLYQGYLKNVTSEAQIKALFSAKNGAFDAADIYIEALKDLIEQAQAGEITREEFVDQADTIITTQLEAAFLLGAEADTVGEEEQAELDDEIEAALDALPRLADDVFAGKFIQEDDTTPPVLNILARLALWGSAALGAYSLGRMVKGAEELMIWLVGPTDHCFPAGAIVETYRGPVTIESIASGDEVETTKGLKPVSFTFERICFGDLIEIKAGLHKTVCTLNHPFKTQRGWVESDELTLSDSVVVFEPTTKMFHGIPIDTIRKIEVKEAGTRVYNLEVEDAHHYVADGFLVHNCTDCSRLDEQIHTGADWRASPWRTQGRNLACKGYNCLCIVVPAPAGAEAAGGF